MNAPTGVTENRLSGVEARLLELDPDLEQLFTEVEEALRVARVRCLPSLRTARGSPAQFVGFRRAPLRPREPRPTSLRARERGPPERRRRSRCPDNGHESEVMPVPTHGTGLARDGTT